MSPRPYGLGQRQATTEQTRARIINAARELLAESSGFSGFSIDAVARQADVARMTVYHQFGSKIGLLEALCDSLAIYVGWSSWPPPSVDRNCSTSWTSTSESLVASGSSTGAFCAGFAVWPHSIRTSSR